MRGQSCSSERRLCSRCPLSVQTVTLVPYESRTLQAPLCLGFAACVRFVVIADSSTSETGCGSPEGPCTRQAAGEPSVRRVASADELRLQVSWVVWRGTTFARSNLRGGADGQHNQAALALSTQSISTKICGAEITGRPGLSPARRSDRNTSRQNCPRALRSHFRYVSV